MDFSQGKFQLFLQSPRQFWMHYNGPFEASHNSPQFTVNSRVGTLAESSTDNIRSSGSGSVGSLPFYAGTPLASMRPFVHPTVPDFNQEFCGRNSWAPWSWARKHGILYQRSSDPFARFNIYGMPDDLLEFEDEKGQKWIVVVDYKTTSTSNWTTKIQEWFDPRNEKYHRGYIVQLEFYAWLMEQIIQRDGLPHRVWPVGHHIAFNVGHDGQTDLGSLQLNLESAHIPIDLDWSWIQPTIDLAIECVLSPDLPPKQGLPNPPNRSTGHPSSALPKHHDFEVSDDRYDWMMSNHPGSWP